MSHWAATFVTGIFIAMLLALLEPVIAASDAGKILFICFALAVFRSPLWMTGRLGSVREGRA